jgi:hypothetical protein
MHQSGTNITGYVTIPFLNLTNTPITGAVQGSAISFGDSNQMVKYDGTFAGPTSATGTFHAIRWGGVDGTWSLTQAMPPFDDVPAVYPVAGIWSNVLTSTMARFGIPWRSGNPETVSALRQASAVGQASSMRDGRSMAVSAVPKRGSSITPVWQRPSSPCSRAPWVLRMP